jgi:hypothetical protein
VPIEILRSQKPVWLERSSHDGFIAFCGAEREAHALNCSNDALTG